MGPIDQVPSDFNSDRVVARLRHDAYRGQSGRLAGTAAAK